MKLLSTLVLASALLPTTAFAMDLDENCSVNIMNRTVQVQADGSWQVANVPSFMGQVRARATCVRDGVTTSGQSEFFRVQDNNLSLVESIFFDNPDPVPVNLRFATSEPIVFQNTGDGLSLLVRADFSDGTSSPVLNASNGINFSSSNAAIVSVDDNGRLTPLSSGRALITARLEGTTAFQEVLVSLGGDSDGDGLPDSYELANNLDPNDPVDASEDIDNDGLIALEEFAAGTNVNSADSDNDGLSDSEELVAGLDGFITNPLSVDTDGDGFSDGLEIDLNTDPIDNQSFDLPNAITTLTVSPSFLPLIFNGVDTEVSEQLVVTAELIDGRSLDITSSAFGTSYSSSDLTVASFGTNSGEVFGGVAGTATITVNNNGLSQTIDVEVERFDPIALSAIDIPGYANNVDAQGDYAYIAAGSAGLVVVDVSDRTAPFVAAQLNTDGVAVDIKVAGNRAYLADGGEGLKIINIDDPLSPELISSVDTRGFAIDLDIDDTHVYIADREGGLAIINIIQEQTPFIASVLDDLPRTNGIAVDGDRLALSSFNLLQLIDIQSRDNPELVSAVGISSLRDIFFEGDYVYIAARSSGYGVVDVADFANPTIVAGDIASPDAGVTFVPRDVVRQGDLLFFAEQLFANAIPLVNVFEPEEATFQSTIDLSPLGDFAGTGIAADNEFIYVTEESFVVRNDFGFTGNTRLFIAQYRQVIDSLGQPPAVSFTEPTVDTVLTQGQPVSISVDAQDDFAVRVVEFLVDGELVFSDNSEPYRFQTTAGFDSDEIEITVRARDWADNVGVATMTRTLRLDTDQDGLADEDEINLHATLIDNPDSDSDGLTDFREILLGTNPNLSDTDSDTVPDGLEIENGTDPLVTDTDGDGLSDAQEIDANTNPVNSDTDGDGLSDSEEINDHQTNPLLADTDGDGLSDSREINDFNTSPLLADTDGDGFDDSDEIRIGSNPNGPADDADADGLPDAQEDLYRTSVTRSDTDSDGILDGEEVQRRLDPRSRDTDRDGVDDNDDTLNDWFLFFANAGIFDNPRRSLVVETLGDINNDGVDDYIASDNLAFSRGEFVVYSGLNGLRLYRRVGSQSGQQLGADAIGIPDIDDDGFNDFIVGDPALNANGTNSGAALIYSGRTGNLLRTLAGSAPSAAFGGKIVDAGDVNADGINDIIIGAADGVIGGDIQVLSGSDFSLIYSLTGRVFDAAGDVNNDGFNDIIVADAINADNGLDSGRVQIFSGADASVLYTFSGEASERLGLQVSQLGDINGDGFDEFIISSSLLSQVYSGFDGDVIYSFPSATTLNDVGDVNNDGVIDIGVGDAGDDTQLTNAGRIDVLSGVDGSLIYSVFGYEANDNLTNVSSAGDIDSDGYGDIIVGARGVARVVASNTDWDNDGLLTLNDPYPLIFMDETTDFDSDGVLDFTEINLGLDPISSDSDGDGLSDGQELNSLFSNPLSSDTDGDGLPDLYEVENNLDLLDASDIQGDQDNDGITNLEEFLLGLQAGNPDSDGDGLSDGEEIASNRTDPTLADTDTDGINDGEDTVDEWLYILRGDNSRGEGADFGRSSFGELVRAAGDVNNDGTPDFMISAPNEDVGDLVDAGRVYVYSGVDRQLLYLLAGDVDRETFGRAISSAGDMNNDGFDDIAVGSSEGIAIVSGADGSVLQELTRPDGSGFGDGDITVGDIDNDGVTDIIAGAPSADETGSIYVFSGTDSRLLYTLNVPAPGVPETEQVRIGRTIVVADFNNDGFDDIASSSIPRRLTAQTAFFVTAGVRIFSGLDGQQLSYITADGAGFAESLAAADTNGDGFTDLVVGSNGFGRFDGFRSDNGSVNIYSGNGFSLLNSLEGDRQGFFFGDEVSSAGDVNLDGYEDILIGSPRLGRVQLVSGKDASFIYEIIGYGEYTSIGESLDSIGDVDSDGHPDFIIGGAFNQVRVVSSNGDWDNDGLPSLVDSTPLSFTDPSIDSDLDGLTDLIEVTVTLTDINNPDTDGDGLSDSEEVNTLLSNPLSNDSDGDGITDLYETQNNLDLNDASDASADSDGDGLSNLQEFLLGTSLVNGDSDGDGLNDGDEFLARTSPVRVDTDRDGIPDPLDTVNDWYFYLLGVNEGTSNSRVSRLQDVSGDGIDEIIFIYDDNLRVFSGLTQTILYERSLNLESLNLRILSVADVGDINLDTTNDFAITTVNSQGFFTEVRVYSGLDGTLLETIRLDNNFSGEVFDSQTDFNQDGVVELVVSELDFDGNVAVSVFSGADNRLLFSFEGSSFTPLDDINNDGYPDILVGFSEAFNIDTFEFGVGRITAYSGRDGSPIYSLLGDQAGILLGAGLAALGDINGDNVNDFAAWEQGFNLVEGDTNLQGRVNLYSGVDGTPIASITGENGRNGFGREIANAGDIDGDGTQDIIISAPFTEEDRSGRVTVFSGADQSILYSVAGQPDDILGRSISAFSDIDNDGVPDILVHASGNGSHIRVVSSNGDWDNDGVGTLDDAFPLDPSRQ